MKFEELLLRYKEGVATPEEIELAEREIEKYEAISDFISDEIEEDFSGPLVNKAQESEIKAIKKLVDRNMYRNIGISIFLIIMIFAIFVSACNVIFYDPNEPYPDLYTGENQLLLDSAAFTELHSPGYIAWWARANRDGPGSYNISISLHNRLGGQDENFIGRIVRGRFDGDHSILHNYWKFAPLPYMSPNFTQMSYPDEKGAVHYGQSEEDIQYFAAPIKELPDSAIVNASIGFEDFMSLQEFFQLFQRWENRNNFYFTYAAVNGGLYNIHAVGFDPSGGAGSILTGLDRLEKTYPYLRLLGHFDELEENRVAVWDAHFRSLVNYLSNRPKFLKAIAGECGLDPQFYKNVLSYIEENGVSIYAVQVNARADELLSFLEQEDIRMLFIDDVKLSWLSN